MATNLEALRRLTDRFDAALDRCALYGNADQVRDNWVHLKVAIYAMLNTAAAPLSGPVDLCEKCGSELDDSRIALCIPCGATLLILSGPVDASGEPTDLHDAIMNIPCRVPFGVGSDAYRLGHRDARHAAAELAAAAVPSSPAQEKEDQMTDTPRRIRVDQFTPAERAIYDAVQAVEAMVADVRLTDAVILLQAARESVADFVDGIADRRRQVIVRDAIAEANRGR